MVVSIHIKFVNNVFHILGESNSEKVQKFKRWFWFIVEKMSLQERQELVRHCVVYTAIVLLWLRAFQTLIPLRVPTHSFSHYFHVKRCIVKMSESITNGRICLKSGVWRTWSWFGCNSSLDQCSLLFSEDSVIVIDQCIIVGTTMA